MIIRSEMKLGFDDVMIEPTLQSMTNITSRKGIELRVRYHFLHSDTTWYGIPIVASNMDHTGTLRMAAALSDRWMLTMLRKSLTVKQALLEDIVNTSLYKTCDLIDLPFVGLSMGVSEEDFNRVDEWYMHLEEQLTCSWSDRNVYVNIDVANGYLSSITKTIEKVAKLFPKVTIIAGNVVSSYRALELFKAGADIIKVGIGSGSVCTTREKTGVGYPQLSAIIECSDAIKNVGGYIMSDGGCRVPGDIVKAFGAGADFVMLGNMLAGHDECGTKEFYGMSSKTAHNKHGTGGKHLTAEGKSVILPSKGSVDNTLQDILGGIRSACTYVGVTTLKDLCGQTAFIRVREQQNKSLDAFVVQE